MHTSFPTFWSCVQLTNFQVSQALANVAKRFTPAGASPDSVIDRVLVISGDRKKVEQDQIPDFFTPVTGQWQQKNLFKVYADDESYNSGHGHAYEAYGVDPKKGALVIVRPDHCELSLNSWAETLGVLTDTEKNRRGKGLRPG